MSGRRVMRRLRWWAVAAVCVTGVAAAALHLSVADGPTVVTAGEDVVPIVPPAPAPAPGPAPAPRSSWTHDAGLGADLDLPDPGALHADGELHVYGTSGPRAWVPHFAGPSPAMPGTDRGDALPDRPAWVAAEDRTIWAPAVARIGDRYVMAFAATAGPGSGSGLGAEHAGLKCVGTALAASPAGPFVARPEPLRCARHHWAIDPYFVDAGDRWYLLWREDHPDHPTGRIVGARLAADGLSLADDPRTLLVGEHPWEDGYPGEGPRALAGVARAPGLGLHARAATTDPAGIGPVENPAMARHPRTGEWLLTWSANRWETPDYATGLAVCEAPLGPCERVSREAPWLRTSAGDAVAGTTARFVGAGGLGFVTAPDGHLYAVFHAYPVAPGAPSVTDDPEARWPTAPRAPWAYRVDAGPTHTYTLTDPP